MNVILASDEAEYRADCLRSAEAAEAGARAAEADGAWKLAAQFWASAASRFKAAGRADRSSFCRGAGADAALYAADSPVGF